jgi:hypothetical protein
MSSWEGLTEITLRFNHLTWPSPPPPGSCRGAAGGGGGFACQCQPGWSGQLCELDLCASAPCQNNGQCTMQQAAGGGAFFRCACTAGWSGATCSTSTVASGGGNAALAPRPTISSPEPPPAPEPEPEPIQAPQASAVVPPPPAPPESCSDQHASCVAVTDASVCFAGAAAAWHIQHCPRRCLQVRRSVRRARGWFDWEFPCVAPVLVTKYLRGLSRRPDPVPGCRGRHSGHHHGRPWGRHLGRLGAVLCGAAAGCGPCCGHRGEPCQCAADRGGLGGGTAIHTPTACGDALAQHDQCRPRGGAVVSRSFACIGSPCLRHCVHGASIGGRRWRPGGW